MKQKEISKNIIIVVLLAVLLSGKVFAASAGQPEGSVSSNEAVEPESSIPNEVIKPEHSVPADEAAESKDSVSSNETAESNNSNLSNEAAESNNSISSNEVTAPAHPTPNESLSDNSVSSNTAVSYEKYAEEELVEDSSAIKPYDTNVLITAYQSYNPQYQKIAIEKELLLGQYQGYGERLHTLDNQLKLVIEMIDAAQKQKEDYEKEGNVIGALNSLVSIENYRSQFKEQLNQYAQAGLQKDLASYKALRGDKAADEQQRALIFDFYRQYTMIPVYSKQTECLKAELSELKETLSVEKVKLKTGHSISITVNQVQTALDLKEAEYSKAVSDYETIKIDLKAQCGIDSIPAIELQSFPDIGEEAYYKNLFMESNVTYAYLNTLLKSYDRYLVYAEKNNIETNVEQAQKNLVQLDMNQYSTIDLPVYIRQFITSYKGARKEAEAVKSELKSNREKQQAMELLISKGQATPLDLLKIKSEESNLNLKYEKLKYDAGIIKFILDNRVENQTIGN